MVPALTPSFSQMARMETISSPFQTDGDGVATGFVYHADSPFLCGSVMGRPRRASPCHLASNQVLPTLASTDMGSGQLDGAFHFLPEGWQRPFHFSSTGDSTISSSWICSTNRVSSLSGLAAVDPHHGDFDDVGGSPLDGGVHRHPLPKGFEVVGCWR